MTARIDSVAAMRNLRSALELQKETRCDRDFCTAENIDEAISTLSEVKQEIFFLRIFYVGAFN